MFTLLAALTFFQPADPPPVIGYGVANVVESYTRTTQSCEASFATEFRYEEVRSSSAVASLRLRSSESRRFRDLIPRPFFGRRLGGCR